MPVCVHVEVCVFLTGRGCVWRRAVYEASWGSWGVALRHRISEHANFAVNMREASWRAHHKWDETKASPEAAQELIKKHRQA